MGSRVNYSFGFVVCGSALRFPFGHTVLAIRFFQHMPSELRHALSTSHDEVKPDKPKASISGIFCGLESRALGLCNGVGFRGLGFIGFRVQEHPSTIDPQHVHRHSS